MPVTACVGGRIGVDAERGGEPWDIVSLPAEGAGDRLDRTLGHVGNSSPTAMLAF
jgi:hypothetical protein